MHTHLFGLHRSLSQPQGGSEGGGTTQSASVVDASLPLHPGEVLLEVTCLLLDAASAAQLHDAHSRGGATVGEAVSEIVRTRFFNHFLRPFKDREARDCNTHTGARCTTP